MNKKIVWIGIASLVVALVIAVVAGVLAMVTAPTQTDVRVGRTYPILIYSCTQGYNKGDGKVVTETMYDVVFISTNPRDMRRQLVLPSYTAKDERLPPGQGGWVEIDRGTIEGLYYGRYTEFRYNGTLQPMSTPLQPCRGKQANR